MRALMFALFIAWVFLGLTDQVHPLFALVGALLVAVTLGFKPTEKGRR